MPRVCAASPGVRASSRSEAAPPVPGTARRRTARVRARRRATRASFTGGSPRSRKRCRWWSSPTFRHRSSAPRSSGAVWVTVALFLKRDDVAGEVVRRKQASQARVPLGDAELHGFRAVLAEGGMGSNQTLATALHARAQGLGVVLLLLPERPSQTTSEHLLAQQALGAEQHMIGVDGARSFASSRSCPKPERPYVIPTGGSSPLGDVGFVAAGFELADQVKSAKLPEPDVVYLPLGTGGSAVGLALGLAAAGHEDARRRRAHREHALRNAGFAPARVPRHGRAADGARPELPGARDRRCEVSKCETATSARATPSPRRKARTRATRARGAAGLELDLTYSAKALAALVDDAPKLRARTSCSGSRTTRAERAAASEGRRIAAASSGATHVEPSRSFFGGPARARQRSARS